MNCFNWTEKSISRNRLTDRFEPIQPLILFEFLSAIGATNVLDIGANVGYYSILMSQLPSIKKVSAFEASPDTFKHLTDNVAMNALEGRIECIQKAVSRQDGTLQFQIESELSGINSVVGASMHRSGLFNKVMTVEACALDGLHVGEGNFIGLKIDVEGHEMEVLRGASNTISKNTGVIQVELYGNALKVASDFLESLGYRRIFSAGSDYYFTNSYSLYSPQSVIGCLEAAISRAIDFNNNRWPKPTSLPKVNVSADIKGHLVKASCRVDGMKFEGSPEYAFYIVAGNERIYIRWYEATPNLEFEVPEMYRGKNILVQGFVRDSERQNRVFHGKSYPKNT